MSYRLSEYLDGKNPEDVLDFTYVSIKLITG